MTPDPDLTAYLDGELPAAAARKVEARLAADLAARSAAAALQKAFDLLDHLPAAAVSPDFAARTVTRIAAVPAGLLATPSYATPAVPPARRGRWRVAAAAAAVLFAVPVGAAARRAARPGEPPVDVTADYRASVRLPWFVGVDDLAFARRLGEPDLFPPGESAPPPAVAAAPAGPADRLIPLFQSFPADRRRQLRALDAAFDALEPADRDRVGRSVEAYAVWLDRLPAADRAAVLAAAAADRAAVVARLKADRANAAAPAAARRAEWARGTARWDAVAPPAKPWPFTDAALAAAVDGYVQDVLKLGPAAPGRLPRDDAADLRQRQSAAARESAWGLYGLQVYRLASRQPYLPEPQANKPVVADLKTALSYFRAGTKKAVLGKVDRDAVGRWPEFALEVADEARKAGLPVPEAFGPCRPAALPDPVRRFLDAELMPRLGDADRHGLRALEGRWPDYPRELVRLAAANDLPVPGVTLPGPPSKWAAVYGE